MRLLFFDFFLYFVHICSHFNEFVDCYFHDWNLDEDYDLLSSSEQLISIQTTGGLQNEVQYITNFVLVDNNPLTVEMQNHNGQDYTMVQISENELNNYKQGRDCCTSCDD